jgi:chromate transport protein ChrA
MQPVRPDPPLEILPDPELSRVSPEKSALERQNAGIVALIGWAIVIDVVFGWPVHLFGVVDTLVLALGFILFYRSINQSDTNSAQIGLCVVTVVALYIFYHTAVTGAVVATIIGSYR